MAKNSLSPEGAQWIRQFQKYGIAPRARRPLVLMFSLITSMAGNPETGRSSPSQIRGRLRFVVDVLNAELPRTERRRRAVA